MNHNQFGEIISSSIEQMIPLLKGGKSAKTPVMELNIKGEKYQAILQLVPEKDWLCRGEVEISE